MEKTELPPRPAYDKFAKKLTNSVMAGVLSKEAALDILDGVKEIQTEAIEYNFKLAREAMREHEDKFIDDMSRKFTKHLMIVAAVGLTVGLVIGLAF